MDYPYPIKDWKNVEEYKNIKSFAWEFLRRSANYQKDFDSTFSKEGVVLEFGRDIVLSYTYKLSVPFELVAPSSANNLKLLPGSIGSSCHVYRAVPDPKIDVLDPAIEINGGQIISYVTHSMLEQDPFDANVRMKYIMQPDTEGDVVIKLNTCDPEKLKIQLKALSKMLLKSNSARSSSREQRKKYIRYLRVLDAVAAGVEITGICAELDPSVDNDYESGYIGSQAIRNNKKAALRLTEGGYLGIAGSEATK